MLQMYHDFLINFVLALVCVAAISEYTAVHLLCLEDTGKPVRKFTNTFCPWRNSLKIFFCSGRRLSSSNCSVIVYCKCSLPTSNCHAQVRIGPIVRCIKKTIWKLPILRNAHIYCTLYLSNYAEYQNELCGTNLQTDYTNGIDHAWAGCNTGYSLQK